MIQIMKNEKSKEFEKEKAAFHKRNLANSRK